jgi:Flp pilus assembly protein TadG
MLEHSRNKPAAGQRGTALIEFALVLPMLIVLTFLVVDFGRAFMVKNMLTQAAREGARQMAVLDSEDQARTATKTVAKAAGLDSSRVVVTITPQGSENNQVSVSAPFQWLYPGLLRYLGVASASSGTLTASCTMRSETS